MTLTLEEMTNELTNTRIIKPIKLRTPKEIKNQIPLSEKAGQTILESRQQIENILDRVDDRFLIITGPCSIDNPKAAIEYAQKLKKLSEQVDDKILLVMRTYFEKPRTTLGWKGLIYDPDLDGTYNIEKGLLKARKILKEITEMGVSTATEFLDTLTPQYIDDLISWVAIGARTSESQPHRELASGLSMPVGFKNNTAGEIETAVNAVKTANSPHKFLGVTENGEYAIFPTKGNPYSHIILRGGNGKPNYNPESVQIAMNLLEKAQLPKNIIIDCSHENSGKQYTKQVGVFQEVLNQRIKGNLNIIGMMLESYLYEGNQNMTGTKYGVSKTDSCINWLTTERIIKQAHESLNN